MCDVCTSGQVVAYGGDDHRAALCGRCARERGVSYKRPSPGYVSPDQYERQQEYLDHQATVSRRRVLDNAVNNRRF